MPLIAAKKVFLKNGQELTLRSPLPEEASVLLAHLKNVLRDSYRNMNHPKNHWDAFPVEEEVKILTDFQNSIQKFMISAFEQNRIVGNLGIFGFGGEFLKHNARLGMGIETEFQNQGLGTALMEYALESAESLGFKRVELTVRAFNLSGIALYEKSGFRRIGLLEKMAFIDNEYHDEYMYETLLG